MKKVLWNGVVIITVMFLLGLFLILTVKYYSLKKKEEETLFHNTNIIQQQIQNVGKLIVTEGQFAEVITYRDKKKYVLDFFSIEKKALIVINAHVTISYNMREVQYDIDEEHKTVTITHIPEPEITINPDIQFYDVDQSQLNPFTGDDYNKISKKVKEDMIMKVAQSSLKSNAQNRLISELQKILIITHSMGWKLRYHDKTIEDIYLLKL